MSALGAATASGVRWGAAAGAVTAALQLLQMAVLGRLLGPEPFGLMAMLLIVTGFVTILRDAGVPEYVVYRQRLDPPALATLAWVNLGGGALLAILVWGAAPWIARGFGAPELVAPARAVAVVFVIGALSAVSRAVLQVRLAFRPIAVADMAGAVVSLAVSVAFALLVRADVWALAWGFLAAAAVRTALLVGAARGAGAFPGMAFQPAEVAGFARFGAYRAGATVLNYLRARVDQLLVGILFGPQWLGFYSMASNLVLQPSQQVNTVLAGVAFPVLSRVRDEPDRLRHGFLKLARLTAAVNAPVMLGALAVAPVALPLIFGADWAPMTPLFMVLAVYALLRALAGVGGSLLMAKGRADWVFRWNLGVMLASPVVIGLAALSGSVLGVAVGLTLFQAALVVAHQAVLTARLLGPILPAFGRAVAAPTLCAAAMAAGVALLPLLPVPGPAPLLAAQLAAGVALYAALCAAFAPDTLREARTLLRGRA